MAKCTSLCCPVSAHSNLAVLVLGLLAAIIAGQVPAQSFAPSDHDEEPGLIFVDGRSFDSLSAAFRAAGDGDEILLTEGSYRQAAVLNASDVRISGAGHVRIHGATARGKGALVINGDNITVANIECYGIAVSDQNGVCVRFQGRNLSLDNVYFHHSEGGLMTNPGAGTVEIRNSHFAHLGYQSFHHGVYFTGSAGELIIRNSLFLATHNEGHEIKSRARRTVIEDSVIASMNAGDSRLIDIPNGGHLVVRNSVLHEGPNSVNWDLIGFAQERNHHPPHKILLQDNLLIGDVQRPSIALGRPEDLVVDIEMRGNITIGEFRRGLGRDTLSLASRAAAGLLPEPILPRPEDIEDWIDRARSATDR